MHTVKCNKFSIYFVKRNNWVTPTDWVNNTEIYRYSSLDWSDSAENNFDTKCIKVDGCFLVLLKRSRRIPFSFFGKSCLLDYQDHFQNPRISLRTSTTIYFKLVASTECMIGFLSNYREHGYVQEIHEAFFWALHDVSSGTLSVAYCQDITRSVLEAFPKHSFSKCSRSRTPEMFTFIDIVNLEFYAWNWTPLKVHLRIYFVILQRLL